MHDHTAYIVCPRCRAMADAMADHERAEHRVDHPLEIPVDCLHDTHRRYDEAVAEAPGDA